MHLWIGRRVRTGAWPAAGRFTTDRLRREAPAGLRGRAGERGRYDRRVTDRLHFTDPTRPTSCSPRDPLALLIGFALDQQVTVQKAFSGPLELSERLGHLDAAPARRDRPRAGVPRAAGDPPLPRRRWPSACRRVCADVAERYDGDAARVWTEAKDGDLEARLEALPGIGQMKVKALSRCWPSASASRSRACRLVPKHPTLGDVDSPEALAEYQAGKRAHKAAMRAAAAAKLQRALRPVGPRA